MKNQDWENGPQLPEKLQKVMAQLRSNVAESLKDSSAKFRRDYGACFIDDEVWRFREATITNVLCILSLRSDKTINQFSLSRFEERILENEFDAEVAKNRFFYLKHLTEKLVIRAKEIAENAISGIVKKLIPVPLSADDQWFEEGTILVLVENNFDRFCWPQLPPKDKELLTGFLQREAGLFFQRIETVIQQLPEKDRAVCFLFREHLLYGIPEQKRQEVYDKGFIHYFKKFEPQYRRLLGHSRTRHKKSSQDPNRKKVEKAYKLALEYPTLNAREVLHRAYPGTSSMKPWSKKYKDKLRKLKNTLGTKHKRETGHRLDWRLRESQKANRKQKIDDK